MRFYFDNRENIKRLGEVLSEWNGTPFRSNSGVKGQGTDCIHYIAGVLMDCGARDRIIVPTYGDEWYRHVNDDRLLSGVKSLGVKSVGFLTPKDGDIILFHFGQSLSHVGFYFDKFIHHILQGSRVHKIGWLSPQWHKRKRLGYRVWEQRVQY